MFIIIHAVSRGSADPGTLNCVRFAAPAAPTDGVQNAYQTSLVRKTAKAMVSVDSSQANFQARGYGGQPILDQTILSHCSAKGLLWPNRGWPAARERRSALHQFIAGDHLDAIPEVLAQSALRQCAPGDRALEGPRASLTTGRRRLEGECASTKRGPGRHPKRI
jgi:hypothetical protein